MSSLFFFLVAAWHSAAWIYYVYLIIQMYYRYVANVSLLNIQVISDFYYYKQSGTEHPYITCMFILSFP